MQPPPDPDSSRYDKASVRIWKETFSLVSSPVYPRFSYPFVFSVLLLRGRQGVEYIMQFHLKQTFQHSKDILVFRQAWATANPFPSRMVVVRGPAGGPMKFCGVREVDVGVARRGLTSSRVFSAIILWIPMPTPSITANKHAQPIAEFRAAFIPPLTASAPPVKNPAMTVRTIRQFQSPSNDPFPCLPPSFPHSTFSHPLQAGALTSIIRILLLPNSLDRTIKRAKQTTPDPEITS